MKAREILQSLLMLVAMSVATGGAARLVGADAGQPQYYEWRVYATKSEAQQKLISDYWQKAAVPAYNRLGVSAVGVFTELQDSPTNKVYVLIPFETPGAYATIPARLAADVAYQTAGADYLNTPKADPAYIRFESSLLVAFDGMKKLAVPPSAADQKPWIFELRTYLSHSEAKGDNKVKMFNNGEIPLMQEVGLTPVFFGQTVVGSQMPNLIYMVSGENQDEHKKHWKGFFDAPVWKKLSGDPQYKDNVSKVISVFLKRTPASQI
ncbi:MAG TPA: NIPSNAP family protein [Candidatus Limnocylindria bacterium]|nr:NIPSNAP family protein [Candidatus Limnocylindria bacterium]